VILREWSYRSNSNVVNSFNSITISLNYLEDEQQFLLSKGNPLNRIIIQLDEEEDEGGDRGGDIIVSPVRAVASIDSIKENANFIELEY
jgi:hypothetical protein